LHFVELSCDTQDFLEKLDNNTKERITSRLRKLEENPIPSDAKFITRLQNEKIFRYRIGDYRALYKIKENIILIIKIDKRQKAYD
jgi:mRNA interferase RelE/StbE